tara:strand:- start:267 stop:845 length:579 start_codon:yes stop_codon:yes gene_type:complete
MPYKLDGNDIGIDSPFTKGGMNYPAGWIRHATDSEKSAVGITWAEAPAWFDSRFYSAPGVARDLAKLKTKWVETQKLTAKNSLGDTDWYITRKTEKSEDVPSDVATYRDNVRTQCKAREDQINACSTVAALAELVTKSPYIRQEKLDTSKEIKKSDGSSYDPKRYESFDPKQFEQVAQSGALKEWPASLTSP